MPIFCVHGCAFDVLKLGGANVRMRGFGEAVPFVVRLSENLHLPEALAKNEAFIVRDGRIPGGFDTYITMRDDLYAAIPDDSKAVLLTSDYDYLADGDVLRIVPERESVRVLYRRGSHYNWFLTTERCNHYCLMCSQPPKLADDSWIVQEILDVLPLMDPGTAEIGLSGGEPTLLGDDFIRILRACKSWLPNTAVHVLSNGRRFTDESFANAYASVEHPDLMVGIPLYSDISTIHDYVVQAEGAYDETIRGILNLKRLGQRVEVRVVIHKQTYERLPRLAEFLARNLLFVDHVALMGLEITGFTRANMDDVWIDPYDYRGELLAATRTLIRNGMNVSIYNHQLCLLPSELWPYARKSISDWKNEYMPECEGCTKRDQCGGFFSSAKLCYSGYIAPFHAAGT